MKIRIREQSGTDTIRKFDFQLAVALSYLLENICNNDAIVILESLEDFAVIKGFDFETQVVDVYQVKTKNNGNYTKSELKDDDVIGKIFLTDYLFDSKSNSLNIVCNQNINLCGKTLEFDNFSFSDKLTDEELKDLSEDALIYLKNNSDYDKTDVKQFFGKLIYIKTIIPFHSIETPYDDMLVGLTSRAITNYLHNPNNTINANAVYQACKFLILQRTKYKLESDAEYSLEDLIRQKGVDVKDVHRIINDASKRNELDKKDYLEYASRYFSPFDHSQIKEYYPEFLSKKDDLQDPVFRIAYLKLKKIYDDGVAKHEDYASLIDYVCQNGYNVLHNYDKPFVQLLTILVVFGG